MLASHGDAQLLVDAVLLVAQALPEIDVGDDLARDRGGGHHPHRAHDGGADHGQLAGDLHQVPGTRVQPHRQADAGGQVPRVRSEVLEDEPMEEVDQGVGGERDVAGRLHEAPIVVVLRGRLHDPVGEEPVASELVEPSSRSSDPASDGRHELVHHQREASKRDRLLHQHGGLADVGRHDEHLNGLAVDHGVQ